MKVYNKVYTTNDKRERERVRVSERERERTTRMWTIHFYKERKIEKRKRDRERNHREKREKEKRKGENEQTGLSLSLSLSLFISCWDLKNGTKITWIDTKPSFSPFFLLFLFLSSLFFFLSFCSIHCVEYLLFPQLQRLLV